MIERLAQAVAGLASIAGMLALATCPARASEDVRPPFDVAAIREAVGTKPKKTFTCPSPPAPVASLDVESKYVPDGKSVTIDPARLKAYQAVTTRLKAFTAPLIKLANEYVRSDPPDARIAACVASWLASWARADALQLPPDRRGEAVRAWTLPIIALAYVQIRKDAALGAADRQAVQAWIGRLATRVETDFSADGDLPSRNNNQRYWAGWSVMAAAAVLNDRAMFEWAVESARIGLRSVTPDGFLPLELQRKQRALGYHIFAAEALTMLAAGAAANGVDLRAENDGALARLTSRSLDGLSDPSLFDQQAGVRQETDIDAASSKLAWVVIAGRQDPDDAVLHWRTQLKSFVSLAAGGDVRLLYDSVSSAWPHAANDALAE